MNNQTIEKLSEMKLTGMIEAVEEQMEQPVYGGLSFEERLAVLVDREYTKRENKRLSRRLKEAGLKQRAAVEDIDYRHPRELDKSVVLSLSYCNWIKQHQNVIITGPTGIGKSYIASALVNKVCREGFTAVYYRASRLFQELSISKGDGSYLKFLNKVAKMDLLVIDDWGLYPLTETERRDLLEILDDRYETRSTLFASQIPVSGWYDLLGEPTVADAIMDRLIHNAHRINLKGDTMRKNKKEDLTHSVQ